MSAVLEDRPLPVVRTKAPPATMVPAIDVSVRAQFARDVLAGLALPHKSIPCTWLYDHRGSQLFEQITHTPEYYPTRNETWILERCAAQIAELAGPGATVIELGSGSSRKTPLLLQALERPARYVPIDISAQTLAESADAVEARFPALDIVPLVGDFTRITTLPGLAATASAGRPLVFFPGSTIGNFTPDEAVALLERIGQAVGRNALMVVGADTTHDPSVLLPAYDDAQGITAEFDRNLLVRINRELGADFNLSAFRHEARWNAGEQRVEMHLVSLYTQRVNLLGRSFRFAVGESLHTESSYKYGLVKFRALAHRAGWSQHQLWMDGQSRFAVHVLERWR